MYYFSCPSCKNNKSFYKIETSNESDSSTGCLIFLLGGILPFLVYGLRCAPNIQCAECGNLFVKPQIPKSTLSKILGRIIFASLLFFLIAPIIICILPCLSDYFTKVEIIKIFKLLYTNIISFPFLVHIILIIVMLYYTSLYIQRIKYGKKYNLRPIGFKSNNV